MSTTTNTIPLPVGEVVIVVLFLALVVAIVGWLIVRAHRRRLDRHG